MNTKKANLSKSLSISEASLKRKALLSLLLPTFVASVASAADLYWGGDYATGSLETASSWYTDASGTIVSGSAPDGDDLFFNTTPENTSGGTIAVNSSLSVESLTFNTTGNTVLSQSGSLGLTIGSGGITLAAGSGSVNLGTGTPLQTQIGASQTWTNNSDSTLRVVNTTQGGAGPTTLNLSTKASGGISFTFKIVDNGSNPISVVVDSSGTGVVEFNQASGGHGAGTTILQGTVRTQSSNNGSVGSGDIVLGDTSGSGNATLENKAQWINNDLTVRAGSSGEKMLDSIYTSSGTFDYRGNITLEDTLYVENSRSMIISGDISGAGDLRKRSGNSYDLTLSGDSDMTGDLIVEVGGGSLTLDEAGSLTFTIGANGVNNKIEFLSDQSLNLDGTFNFDLIGASLAGGNVWTIVDAASANYGATFNVAGFTEDANIWTNGSGLAFSELTGQLTYAIPEPSTAAFLFGGGIALFLITRRERK